LANELKCRTGQRRADVLKQERGQLSIGFEYGTKQGGDKDDAGEQ
jgi:hypothetical protein